jgi:hypothetical protein
LSDHQKISLMTHDNWTQKIRWWEYAKHDDLSDDTSSLTDHKEKD